MNFFRNKKLFLIGCLGSIIIAALDLISKKIIFKILENEHYINHSIEISSFFNLVKVWNRGVSFGMFGGLEYSQIIFSTIVFIILVILLVWLYRNQKTYIAYALSFIIGGALGNLFDRIKNGAVADFLDFHLASYHWPAFNIADSFVFIGVAMLIIDDLFLGKK